MNTAQLRIGDLVKLKHYVNISGLIFIWDIIGDPQSPDLIVNLPKERKTAGNYRAVNNKQDYNLYPTHDYILVKSYDLLKSNADVFEGDLELMRDILQNRKIYNQLAEFVFNLYLQSIIDRLYLNEKILPGLETAVLTNKYFTVSAANPNNPKEADARNNLINCIKLYLKSDGYLFWVIKRIKNFSSIANQIATEDGISLLQKLKDDRNLLNKLILLTADSSLYKTTTYSPVDTKTHKPITHQVNRSFLGFFQEDVKNYEQSLKESVFWKNELSKNLGGIDLSNFEEQLLNGVFPEFQRKLFKDLGKELPIEKKINGKVSQSYILEFYLPLFKWILPDVFCDNPRMSPSDLRKQHIRHIKDFIAGKI